MRKIYGLPVATPINPNKLGGSGVAVGDTPPQDTSLLWVDTSDNSGGGTSSGGGSCGTLGEEEKSLMLNLFRNAAYTADMSASIAQLEELWNNNGGSGGEEEPDEPDVPVNPDEPDEPVGPEVTLTSISATYSGGDVEVGTSVTVLTGIKVTAHYSNGTSATVTGYTLSGTIAEGRNTITVSYGGKTTSFTVTGNVVDDGSVALTWDAGSINNNGVQSGGSHSNIFDVRDATKVIITTTSTAWTTVGLRTFNSLDDEIGAGTGYINADVNYIDNDPSSTNRGDTAVCNVTNASFVCIKFDQYAPELARTHITVRLE